MAAETNTPYMWLFAWRGFFVARVFGVASREEAEAIIRERRPAYIPLGTQLTFVECKWMGPKIVKPRRRTWRQRAEHVTR